MIVRRRIELYLATVSIPLAMRPLQSPYSRVAVEGLRGQTTRTQSEQSTCLTSTRRDQRWAATPPTLQSSIEDGNAVSFNVFSTPLDRGLSPPIRTPEMCQFVFTRSCLAKHLEPGKLPFARSFRRWSQRQQSIHVVCKDHRIGEISSPTAIIFAV